MSNKPLLIPQLTFSAKKAAPKKKPAAKKANDPSFKPYLHNTAILLDTSALKTLQSVPSNTNAPKPVPIPVLPSKNEFVMRPKAHKKIRLLPVSFEKDEQTKRQRVEEEQTDIKCITPFQTDVTQFTGRPWFIYSARFKQLESLIPVPNDVEMLTSLSQEDVDYSIRGFAVVIVVISFDAENTHSTVVTMYEKKKQLPDDAKKFFLPPLVPTTNIQFYLQRNGQTIRVANADKFTGQLLHGSIIGVVLKTVPNTTDCIVEQIIFPNADVPMLVDNLPKRETIICSNLMTDQQSEEEWKSFSNNLAEKVKCSCYSALKPIVFFQNLFIKRPDNKAIERFSNLIEKCAAFGTLVVIPGWNDPTLRTFPQKPFHPVIFGSTSLVTTPVIFCPNPCAYYEDDLCCKYAWLEYDVIQMIYKLSFGIAIGQLNEKHVDGWNLDHLSEDQVIQVLKLLIHLRHWCPITPLFTTTGPIDETTDPLVMQSIPETIIIFGCPSNFVSKTTVDLEGSTIDLYFSS